MKKINLILIYFISFIYMEFLYKTLVYDNIFRVSIINMILFLFPLSIFLTWLTKLFKNEKNNKIVFMIILAIITAWFSAEYVVKSYFDFYISISTFQVADQMVDFFGKVVLEVLKRIPGIILFFVPFILCIIFNKKLDLRHNDYRKGLAHIVVALIFYGVYLWGLNMGKDKEFSAYELYYNINNVSLNIENLGVLNTFCLDLKRALFGFNEKIDVDNTLNEEVPKDNDRNEQEIVYEYNNLNIDFDSLISSESNNTIKQMHEYFKNDTGTLQNEYTGMFKGKNLILFMAESFNEVAVNEKLTPTLYKLINSGFVFENFYTPTIFSTIGGEFQEMTGLYAQSTAILKKFRSGEIYFPQGVGNKFKELNYSTFAYHNNAGSFQDRNKYLKSLGLDNFKACYVKGNDLSELINCKQWPQSDVEMINATVDDYINEDNFMVFYATVSGHAGYTWGNAMAKKHKEEFLASGLKYSEGPSSYIAAQMELDRALETLIEKLKEAGKLEDTVIALVGDHYPYELTIDEINEISPYKKEEVVTVNKSNFILWNSEMDTVKVDKVGSQIDVIPTIYNTFGINYDSRLFIGKDILSTEGGLAMFANNSWVTDKGTYYTNSRKFIPRDGVEVEDDYVSKINKIVSSKITMSKNIIENNYYKKIGW